MSSYALAYSGLVESLWFLAIYGFMRPHEAYSQVKIYADMALEMDDNLSEAHYAQGMVKHFFEWDWDGARTAYSPRNRVESQECHGSLLVCLPLRDVR